MDISQESIESLQELCDQLVQEAGHLQIVGRALTPAEQERLDRLQRFIEAIRRILDTHPPLAPPPDNILLDGRYEGGNHELYIELRIDEDVSGVISADFYRNGPTGRSYACSIRTNPGVSVRRDEGSWEIIGCDQEGRTGTGTLTLEPQAPDGSSLTGWVHIDTAVAGLPVRNPINFAADFASPRMRRLGIELEREETVDPLPGYDLDGTEITLRSSLEEAGFDVVNVGESTIIPAPQYNWGTAQLHALMVDLAQASLDRPAWELHLLLLGESTRSTLLGIMFDSSDPLPRQGSAVFAAAIENFTTDVQFPREVIQTTVHELGHALNLAHRFEREVGRGDSLSFMNYDSRYLGGGHINEYWDNFRFTFDSDELEFLRHAPRHQVIPGGASFHSVNYWSDGNGGYTPYSPEVPITFFELTLSPPASGTIFDFAQPVFLEVTLENLSNSYFNLTPEILDPKAGFLEIIVRRRAGNGPGERFIPVMERYFKASRDRRAYLAPGETISNNLNLTFGSAGFPFAEPGEYDVTVLLAFYSSANDCDLVVKSNTLKIRIRYPEGSDADDDGMVLLSDEVGLYFALGGSRVLTSAHDALEEIRRRRQGKTTEINDPIVANIVRCQGIDAGRPYERYIEGKFKSYEGDRGKAADLLKQLTPSVLNKAFDPITAKSTARLADKHAAAAGKGARKK